MKTEDRRKTADLTCQKWVTELGKCVKKNIDKVSCGNHYRYSCGLCIYDDDGNEKGKGWCNGECYWSYSQDKCKKRTTVNCGNHRASSCASCPYDGEKQKGENWCKGVCSWVPGETKCVMYSKLDLEDENGKETIITVVVISIIVVSIVSFLVVLKKRNKAQNEEIVDNCETPEEISNNLLTTNNICQEESHYINADEMEVVDLL